MCASDAAIKTATFRAVYIRALAWLSLDAQLKQLSLYIVSFFQLISAVCILFIILCLCCEDKLEYFGMCGFFHLYTTVYI